MWVQQSRYKKVGELLAKARNRAKLTQIELATRLGKPQSFVSSYEGGQRRIDVLELLKIAKAIGEDPEKLFSEIVRSQSSPKPSK